MEQARSCFYYVEFQPRIAAFQVATAIRGRHRLCFTARAVCGTNLERIGAKPEEICSWAHPAPELTPRSHLELKLSPQGVLHVRFSSRGRGEGVLGSEMTRLLQEPIHSLNNTLQHMSKSTNFAGSAACAGKEISTSISLHINCGFCGNTISKPDFSFNRILPLPSNDWAEFAGNTFCHTHSHTSPLTPHQLHPRHGDCLTGEGVIRVRGDGVRSDRVIIDKSVLCSRCFLKVGRVMEGVPTEPSKDISTLSLEFSLPNVSVTPFCSSYPSTTTSSSTSSTSSSTTSSSTTSSTSSTTSSSSSFPSLLSPLLNGSISQLEPLLASLLYHMSLEKSAFKFLVQDKDKHVYIHLWMLNTVSYILHSDSSPFSSSPSSTSPSSSPSSSPSFSSFSSSSPSSFSFSSTISSCSSSSSSSPLPSSPVLLADRFTGIPSSPSTSSSIQPVLKVLYRIATATDPSLWSHDLGVEPLLLSQEECLWLLVLLSQSSKVIPPTQRNMNGFVVGFLRISPPQT